MEDGLLGYNSSNNRYGILNRMDLWEVEGLHCGDCLEVLIDGEWIVDRIEMSSQNGWYLVKGKLTCDELEGIKVRVVKNNGKARAI